MAAYTVQQASLTGLNASFVAVSASDTFVNDGRTYLHVKNQNASTCNVGVDSVTLCNYGSDHNLAIAIPTTAERVIGPFDPNRFGTTVTVTYDVTASVTAAAVKL